MASELGARHKRNLVLRAVVVLGLAIFGYSAFASSLAHYSHDFDQVRATTGKRLQVPGVVVKTAPQTVDPATGTFSFTVTDVEGRGQTMRVVSRQVKPGNFDEASQVVCIGEFRDGVFRADKLLVKCPSKELDKLRATEGGT